MNMVEQVARALFKERYKAPGTYQDLPWEKFNNKELYYAEARAALKAMREPTIKMVDEGAKKTGWHNNTIVDIMKVEDIYKTMMDTALSEK